MPGNGSSIIINVSTPNPDGNNLSWWNRARGRPQIDDESKTESPGAYREITSFAETTLLASRKMTLSSQRWLMKLRLQVRNDKWKSIRQSRVILFFFSNPRRLQNSFPPWLHTVRLSDGWNFVVDGSTLRQRPPSDRLAYTEDWARTLRIRTSSLSAASMVLSGPSLFHAAESSRGQRHHRRRGD